nr:hypothetical protein [Tanacetum cinerariifolium]
MWYLADRDVFEEEYMIASEAFELLKISDDLFTYDTPFGMPHDSLTNDDLDVYEPRVCYDENEQIYVEAVILINKILVRLIDITVDQWLDLKFGDHKKVDREIMEEVYALWLYWTRGDDEVVLTDEELEYEKVSEEKEIVEIFSTWMAFGGNTHDLGSFWEEIDEIATLHQSRRRKSHTVAEDGITIPCDNGFAAVLAVLITRASQSRQHGVGNKMHKAFQLPVPANSPSTTTTDTTSGDAGTKSGKTVTLTAEDMKKKKNDAAILKTFDGNEATKKTKKNLLKQQYGNFIAEGSETLEQTFTQKFLTSLAPEWLMHTIVWRNRSDLDTMSLDDLYNHLKDWSYMANDEEDHALVTDDVTPTEFTFMANTSAESKYKFPLPVKVVATTRRLKMPLPEVCTAMEEKKKKLPVKDRWQVPTDTNPDDTTTRRDVEKSGRTVTFATEDMQKKKNDVKARTTLHLSLLDEHQLRLQVIVSQLQFMDVEVEKDDLNQKFLTSLAPEWLMHTIVWRNRNDLDTMSLDDLYNHLKHSSGDEDGNTACVPTASTTVPTASASVATISQDTASAYIASQSTGSQIKFEDINQIDENNMEEMDIKWSMALLSMRADKFWKKTGKKISIQGSDVAGFDKSKVECFNYHKMGHFAREYRAPRSQERGRIIGRGLKLTDCGTHFCNEQFAKVMLKYGVTHRLSIAYHPKALMAIDGVRWDWSYMANEGEDHALVADVEAPTEFAFMANTESKGSVFLVLVFRNPWDCQGVQGGGRYNGLSGWCLIAAGGVDGVAGFWREIGQRDVQYLSV